MLRFEPHSHTEYSNIRLLDSINKPKNLIDRAIELGLSGIAITDHDCVGGHIKINKYAQEIQKTHPNFKVALGNEIYLCLNRESGQKYHHFILIAKNKQGQAALRELSSQAWLNSFVDRGMERVVTTYEDLVKIVKKYPNSLIATSACLGGQLSTLVNELIIAENARNESGIIKNRDEIIDFLSFCKSLFKTDFYIEVAPGQSKEQIRVNKRLKNVAKAFDIKMVIGTDAHFLRKEDRFVHQNYLNSKDGEREVGAFYEYAYLQDEEQIKENLAPSLLDDYDIMVQNSYEIYQKIENYSLHHNQTIPKIFTLSENDLQYSEIPIHYPVLRMMANGSDLYERYWIQECINKLKELDKYSDIYLARLEEEADIKKTIGQKLNTNMFAYPITLQHYIDLFWECGSLVGAGRGSSCAGLNHYLLGITQLDPIEWNLPFWRLKLLRNSLPTWQHVV